MWKKGNPSEVFDSFEVGVCNTMYACVNVYVWEGIRNVINKKFRLLPW